MKEVGARAGAGKQHRLLRKGGWEQATQTREGVRAKGVKYMREPVEKDPL